MKYSRIVELTDLMRELHSEVARGYADRGRESSSLFEYWHAVMHGLVEAERGLLDLQIRANQSD